jgi:hypothetical protein
MAIFSIGATNLQHRRNDQIRRLAGDSGDHCLARRCDADADFVAELAEFDPQTLAETVVGRCQKENSHGFFHFIFHLLT